MYFSTAAHRAIIHQRWVKNMLANRIRPMNYDAIREMSDAALNIYTRIDLFLSHKPLWKRKAYDLIRVELNLKGGRYKTACARHQKLKELRTELNGPELTNGRLKLEIERTADGTDYNLVATKQPRIEVKRTSIKALCGKDEATALAEEILTDLKRYPKGGRTKHSKKPTTEAATQ